MAKKLKITQNLKSKIIELYPNRTLKIPAQPNTKYELLDENEQVIAEPKAVNEGTDLAIYTDQSTPDVIIIDYKTYVPTFTEGTVDLAIFNTEKVLASEVTTIGISNAAKYSMWGLGVLGTAFAN